MKTEHEHFSIRWVTTKDRASYFESDTSYEIHIYDKRTNEIWETFYRSEYGNSNGWDYSGVEEIGFSDDGKYLLVKMEGKDEIKKHKLPL